VGLRGGIGTSQADVARLTPYLQPVLARERVRYIGEPVAAVFAEDPNTAEDAADLVIVETEELPVPLTAEGAPGEFAFGHLSEAGMIRKGYGNVEAPFDTTQAVVELDLVVGRHSGVPLETRGALACQNPQRTSSSSMAPPRCRNATRDVLARVLGRSPASVHLCEGHVGGGFGIRGELYFEDVLVSLAAMRFGRPVKWIEDRREHLMAGNHSREQRHRVRAAVPAGLLLDVLEVILTTGDAAQMNNAADHQPDAGSWRTWLVPFSG
jgi:CO/xanthine dehydrogenase Mo-binding subunit